MIFRPMPLDGAWLLELEPRMDDRGFFARAWCRREFDRHGLVADFVQANVSCSARRGTIRGLHYQRAPFEEAKLLRCTRGAVWDVLVDLRVDSPTYLQWYGVELTAESGWQVYVPKGCAHGYQALVDETEVVYQVTEFYTPDAERGIRWNDPRFAIRWPVQNPTMSPKDASWPDFVPERAPTSDAGTRTILVEQE